MDCSTPGFPVLHYLTKFAQTHIHWVSDAIQPSHPLLPPSPLALNLSQHQSQLFASGGPSTGASASAPILSMNFQHWFPLGLTGWSPCCPRDSCKNNGAQISPSCSSQCGSLFSGWRYWRKPEMLITVGSKEPPLEIHIDIISSWETKPPSSYSILMQCWLYGNFPEVQVSEAVLMLATKEKSLIGRTQTTIFWQGGTFQTCMSGGYYWTATLKLMMISLGNWSQP